MGKISLTHAVGRTSYVFILIDINAALISVLRVETVSETVIGFQVVTQRKKTKNSARRDGDSASRSLHELTLDNMVHGVAISNVDGELVKFNRAAEEMLGIGITSALKEEWSPHYGLFYPDKTTLFPTDKLPLVRALDGEVVKGELLFVRNAKRKNGIFIRVNARPLRDEDGIIQGASAIISDVTEEIKAIQALQKKEKNLKTLRKSVEVANQENSAYLANISHEFRTPLGIILGYSEMIEDAKDLPRPVQEWISVVKRNGEHLLSLVEEVLELSKNELGKAELENSRFNVREEIADSLAGLKELAENKGLAFELDFSSSVPESGLSCPLRLRQILINVVGNATKFTSRGSVSVCVDYKDPFLEVVVSDSGVGIPSDYRESLFKPFSQANFHTQKKYGGTGLGLTLSRKLATLLGGDLSLVSSELGKGSVFNFQVKLTASEVAPRLHVRQKNTDTKKNLHSKRILLVEDCEDNQKLVNYFLSRAGASVDFADDGEMAIEKANKGSYDLVLMDLQMPRMDGHEAVCRLRDSGYSVPIVALSAHAMKNEREQCFREGCDDYLTKPIDSKRLIETVSNCCAS